MSAAAGLAPMVLGAVAAVVFVLLEGRVVAQAAVFLLLAAVPLVVLLAVRPGLSPTAVARSRFLLVGTGTYLLATVGWVGYPALGRELPAPSVVDVLYVASYACFAGLLVKLAGQYRTVDARGGLDALIVALGATPVLWHLALEDQVGGARDLSGLTFVLYPLAVLLLFTLGMRVVLLATHRSLRHALLSGWLLLELVPDTIYGALSLDGSFQFGVGAWQALWPLSYGCLASYLMREARSSTDFFHEEPSRLSRPRTRQLLLTGSLLVPAVVGGVEAAVGHTSTAVFSLGVLCLMSVLVVVRLSGVSVDLEQQALAQAELERLTEDLRHLAFHDPLTGLANRALLGQRIEHSLTRRSRSPESATAVLVLDLDDFKTVNDTMGHDAGDRLLEQAADNLRRTCRTEDTVARLGGDEFAVLLEDATPMSALAMAARLVRALQEPMPVEDRVMRPLASVGISLADREQDRSTLLAEADVAMYAAKAKGGNGYELFDPQQHASVLALHRLDRDVKEAQDRGELRLVYQPVMHLPTMQVVGVEALVRWDHPERGLVPPTEFIPLAEANGTIDRLGRWVLEQACRQRVAWAAERPDLPPLSMAVNVSPLQLADGDFAVDATRIVRAAGLSPADVVLEVTESALAREGDLVARLFELRAAGFQIALDDFGTGYSALSQLRGLPLDIVKIDRSFVAGIAREPEEWALTTAIVRLANSLRKTTLAEGVELGAQLAHLRSLGCEHAQGYLFARPMPPEELSAFRDGTRAPSSPG